MEIIKTDKPELLAIKLVEEKIKLFKNQPILLLLSGGSWLSIYEKINPEDFTEHVTIGMLDERFSNDKTINNFVQFKQTHIYEEFVQKGVKFIDTQVHEAETLESLTKRFEKSLRDWRVQNPTGIILATMGMGPDGHTAGIFSTLDISNIPKDDWVTGYEVDESVNQFTKRVTVTPHFLIREIQEAICYVAGESKCEVLKSIISKNESSKNYPALIWQEMKGVVVVTDCKI